MTPETANTEEAAPWSPAREEQFRRHADAQGWLEPEDAQRWRAAIKTVGLSEPAVVRALALAFVAAVETGEVTFPLSIHRKQPTPAAA
jgi:hypothetical protein